MFSPRSPCINYNKRRDTLAYKILCALALKKYIINALNCLNFRQVKCKNRMKNLSLHSQRQTKHAKNPSKVKKKKKKENVSVVRGIS